MSDLAFPESVLDALSREPGRVVFEQGGRSVTRDELLAMIWRWAGGLREAGLGPGRGLAIRAGVSPEAFAVQIAAHVVGCRVVGIRPGYSEGQLAHVLGMGVDALVVDRAGEGFGRVPVLSLDAPPGARSAREVTARPEDVAALNFTSGSTGNPKGCAITYRALGEHWSWQPRVWSPVARELAGAFERYLVFGTLASMVVMEFLALCVLGEGTAVIPEDDGRPLFPYAVERYGITGSIITVPRLCLMLDLLRDESADVSSLRGLMVSGSPLSPDRLAQALERLGPVVYQGYGQTEAGSVSMLTPADLQGGPARLLGSVGRPHPDVEISVRDGEIYLRSPYLMAGYWGDEAETGEVLRDGWLRTRDLGHVDEDGFLYLTGRARDVVMVNAMVVYAGPIERVLADHPDVMEAYVVGAPDERTGEAVHAFVVPARGREPDRAALRALVRTELGADSVPSTITAVSGVPVAAGGKPDKAALLSDRSLRIARQH
ncbi:class I adenylate-forming enzyme family protein [Spirillospora sp. CA-294931]|uniref:class I adenylate-forming enzyme family protein n=1 Tax=Spirillospora sp. CA-294931 TaxID=3240042 RepID=UPI003D8EFCEC